MLTRILFGAALCASPLQAGHELDNRDLALGETLYQDHCASCHGQDLEGQPDWRSADENGVLPAPPHDETGHTWHHSNAQLFDYTQLGGAEIARRFGLDTFASGMPGFGESLSDDDIWSVLAFIRNSWPPHIRDLHASRNPPHP